MPSSTVSRDSTPLAPYFLIVAVSSASIGAVVTLLGEFRDQFGLSAFETAMVVALGFVGSLVAQLTIGPSADRGHAPTMIRIGLTMGVLGLIGMAVADALALLLVSRLLVGFGGGMLLPAIRRTVVVADPAKLGDNLGRLLFYDIGGFLLGPIIAGLLADRTSLEVPFLVFATCLLLLAPAAIRLRPDTAAKSDRRGVATDLLADRRIAGGLLMVFGYFALIGGFEAIWALQLTDAGASESMIGLSITLVAVPLAIFVRFGGVWAQRWGVWRTAVGLMLLVAGVSLGYGLVPGIWPLTAYAAVVGIIEAVAAPATQMVVTQAAPESRQAGAQGLYGATEVASAAVWSLVAGVLYGVGGATLAWTAVAIGIAVFAIVGGALARPERPVSATDPKTTPGASRSSYP